MRREGVCLGRQIVFLVLCMLARDALAFGSNIVINAAELKHRIAVIMDVGYYIHVLDQNDIKVKQDSSADDPYRTYSGCATREFFVNFPADISASIAGAAGSAAGGDWSVTLKALNGLAGELISVPFGTTPVEICVKGEKINLEALTGGDESVHVADITIQFIKSGLPTS
jgi:hypothetical protein